MIILQKKWFVVAGLLVASAVILAACSSVPWAAAQSDPTPVPTVVAEGEASAEGRLMPLRSSRLSFQTSGELAEVLVTEGDVVAKGDVLARLGKREPLEAELRLAEYELLSAQQALDELNETAELDRKQREQELIAARDALNQAQKALNDLDTDDFQVQLDDRNITVEDTKSALDDASEELEKYQDLDPDNATRENAQTMYDDALRAYNDAVYERASLKHQLDQARAAVDLAASRLDEAQRQVDNRADGVDPDSLAIAQARVDLASAQVSAAQRMLTNADLIAPYSGTVVELNDLESGETVTPGQTVVTLADFSAWIVETRDLTELDVVDVAAGQEVAVTLDALPEAELAGRVESISQEFTERSGDILYTVRIRLEETDPRLRWGMTVIAVFEP